MSMSIRSKVKVRSCLEICCFIDAGGKGSGQDDDQIGAHLG